MTTSSIFKRIALFFDRVPVIKKRSVIDVKNKVYHTLVGYMLLLILQTIPFFGLEILSRSSRYNLIFANSQNLSSLARNAFMVSSLFFNVLYTVFKDSSYQKDKEGIIRGIRNLSILVGIVRNLILLVTRELGVNTILLYPLSYLKYVLVGYFIQTFLGSLVTLWVEEYLESYGIGSTYTLMYYQLIDLGFHVFDHPIPGTFGYLSLLKLLFLLLFLVFIDRFFEQSYTLEHAQLRGIHKVYKFNPSVLLSSASMIHSILKNSFYNLGVLIINPFLYYVQMYLLGKVYWIIPDWVFEHMFFTEDYMILGYFRSFNLIFLKVLLTLSVDTLFYGLVLKYIYVFEPQYQPEMIGSYLKSVNLRVKNQKDPLLYFKEELKRFCTVCFLIGIVTFNLENLLVIYGNLIKSGQFVYFYGRMCSLLELFKNDQELVRYFKLDPKTERYL